MQITQRILLCATSLGALGTLVFGVTVFAGGKSFFGAVFLIGWLIVPYVLFSVAGSLFQSFADQVCICVGGIASVLLGVCEIIAVFFVFPPDAQLGLVFLVLPFHQLMLLLTSMAIAFVVSSLFR